jgi:hypothetical protein
MRDPQPLPLLAATALLLLGCSGSEDPATAGPAPEAQAGQDFTPIAAPSKPMTDLELVEDRTEEVADRLLSFSAVLVKQDFEAAEAWLADDFLGMGFAGLLVSSETTQLQGVVSRDFDVSQAPIVDKTGLIASWEETFGKWGQVSSVIWKVKGAEFQQGGRPSGRIRLYLHATGILPDGTMQSFAAWGWARVKRVGDWVIDRLEFTSYNFKTLSKAPYVEVTNAAGVGHTFARFGSDQNRSFHFNGAAAGDVDGDGDWDLFVPSDERNFLYIAQPDGTYTEEAVQRAVDQPDDGTGAVFFDFDNDGDQDLFVAQVGWALEDDRGGHHCVLYTNDGAGNFTQASELAGLGSPFVAYSPTVLDFDGDGWLDIFLSCYGMVEREHNNSWFQATNGYPNALLRNLGEGKGFEDVATKLGMAGSKWSYASAAADIDLDGDPDLYVANDYGDNEFWINAGDGTFEQQSDALGVTDRGNGMGVSFGDLNQDGRLDLYVSNMSSTAGNRILDRLEDSIDPETFQVLRKLAAGNSIFFQEEDGTLKRLPKTAGGVGASWAWSANLADLNLDGRLDIFCTNGFVTGNLAFDT